MPTSYGTRSEHSTQTCSGVHRLLSTMEILRRLAACSCIGYIAPLRQYLDLMQFILDRGVEQQDRTGTGTLSWFGAQMRFDLADGFPLLTTKKLHLTSIIVGLLRFLHGDTNIAWLKDRNVRIWDEWADENGDLGPVYGKQWRDWETPDGGHIDQIANLIELIRRDPYSRRQIVTAWNPGEISKMALAPCHCLFQTQ